jgi:hypothetical protein
MKNLLFLLLLLPELAFAQECNCLNDYQWVKSFFEKNDAGFQMTIDKKGIENYQLFCDSIEQIVKNTKNIIECKQTLEDWTKFFRKGHIGIELNNEANNTDTLIKNYSSVSYTKKDIKSNIINGIDNSDIQGIWKSKNYTIGIIKDSLNPKRDYVGFIIDSRYPEWKKGMLKLEIFKNTDGKYSCNYLMFDHSISKYHLVLKDKNQIEIGDAFSTLYREIIFKDKTDSLDVALLFSEFPQFNLISDKTVLLRLPSFQNYQKYLINDLLKKYKKELLSHSNLIIDIRNNGGGSDVSYDKIMPLLYTNPIKTANVVFLSTPANNNYLYENNSSFLARLIIKKYIKKLNNHIGEFVNILGKDTIITTYKKVYKYPSNVYILINENCASSAEQFILNAEQSTKVTLVGKNTFGALDVSNVAEAVSPDSLFMLYYSVSKTLRPQEQYIDGKGISPDIVIDSSVKDYQWLKFVLDIIDKKDEL